MFFRTFGNRLRHAGMDFSNTIRSKLLPALAAFALFFVVSAAYFAPQFRGEALPQHDVIQYEGMAKDISDMRAATGEDPQWTGGMFGGMPAYLINVAYPAQLVKRTVGQVVKIIDTPAGFLFFAMVSMWLMLLIVGINPWVGIVAALAYGLSTYFLLIIGAGHVTKMWALVYAPLMMGGAWMTLRGNVWCGAALTGLAASLEIGANHPQITYYFLVAMAAFWISEGILSFREGRLRDFSLRTAALVAAGILAVGSNFSPLWYPPLEGDHPRRIGACRDGRNLEKRPRTRLCDGVELRQGRNPQPARTRLHGPRIGHDLPGRRTDGGRAERLRSARRGAAALGLLGHAALHGRPDLSGRRGGVPRRAGHRAGPGAQQMVDHRRMRRDDSAGLGPQPDGVHRIRVQIPARIQ